MNLKINEVYTFKMASSEEVVAKVLSVQDNLVTISHPLSVMPGPNGAGLISALFTVDPRNEIRLNMNAVAIIAPTEDGVKAKYLEATTGIKLPEKKLILG